MEEIRKVLSFSLLLLPFASFGSSLLLFSAPQITSAVVAELERTVDQIRNMLPEQSKALATSTTDVLQLIANQLGVPPRNMMVAILPAETSSI
jgi:hypothetical protein